MDPSHVPQSSVLLPNRIDEYAASSPAKTLISVQRTENPEEGFHDVSYSEFARAINRASWWLDERISRSESIDTLTYLGPADLRLPILVLAAIKTGHQLLLISPYLPTATTARLLDKVRCRTILRAQSIDTQQACYNLQNAGLDVPDVMIPELGDWLSQPGEVMHYPYKKSWESAKDDVIVSGHTSGTTGDPKLLNYRNRTIACLDSFSQLGEQDPELLLNSWRNRRVASNFPFYHLPSLCVQIFFPIYYNMIPVVPYPYVAATPARFAGLLKHGNVVDIFPSPSIIHDMVRNPELRGALSGPRKLCVGSAPFDVSVADSLIASGTLVQEIYGSTEITFPPLYRNADPTEWRFIRFHPYCGLTFEPRDNGMFECVVMKKAGYENFQPVFGTMPHLDRYETKDLFTPHPDRQDVWRFEGRLDDMIALSSGQKLWVADSEKVLQRCDSVRSVLIGGQGRPKPFVLIELSEGGTNNERVEISIKSAITKANESLRNAALLTWDLTIVASPSNSFVRTLKGSIDRRKTIGLYADELEQLYAALKPGGERMLSFG